MLAARELCREEYLGEVLLLVRQEVGGALIAGSRVKRPRSGAMSAPI